MDKNKKKTDLERVTAEIEKSERKFSGMVSFNDLFTSSFMTAHTQFPNFKELLDAGKYNVNSLADFNNILNTEFDNFINSKTNFKTWQEMQSCAVDEYFKKKN
ncbi:MAG: hypothetical protein Q8912_03680 [Bacillota bacterium]|nr:hypothetical protein [Bacillota bacterium]MDP4158727.1 hypothetical protein [Bacillota bacterium]